MDTNSNIAPTMFVDINGRRRRGQIQEIAEALAENFAKKYPGGGPAVNDIEDNDLRNWFGKVISNHVLNMPVLEGEALNMEEVLGSTEYNEIVQAIPIAVSLWRSQGAKHATASTPLNCDNGKSSSFSLLDQLQGGLLANFVAIEDIIEASSEEERLKLLKKIVHVDDIAHDWDQIIPMLNKSLRKCDEDSSMLLEYLQLYRIWFDQGRSSVEYTRLQYDLCRITMLALQSRITILFDRKLKDSKRLSTYNEAWYNDKLLVQMVQIWHDMWTDLMQRGVYSEQWAESIEITMLLWLRDFSFSGNAPMKRSAEPFPTQVVLALIDPQASWLLSWTRLVSSERLVLLIERTGILPSILRRCAMASALRRTAESYEHGNGQHWPIREQVLHLHSLAVLHAIIAKTRVSHFPWQVVSTESPLNQLDPQPMCTVDLVDKATAICLSLRENDNATAQVTESTTTPKGRALKEVFEIFISALEGTANIDGLWRKLCGDAIETILWGCSTINHPFNVDKIKYRIKAVESADDDNYSGTLLDSLDAIQWRPA